MRRIEIGRWTLEADVEANQAAYSKIEIGSPEDCGCEPCLNFAVERKTNYPDEFRQFAREAGFLFDREAEIYHLCQVDNGLHLYGGFFRNRSRHQTVLPAV